MQEPWMPDLGPEHDPDPRPCRNCGERWRPCVALWPMNMMCCGACDHPRSRYVFPGEDEE